MRILFCTNLPSPYRVVFFNELGKLCDLTVCYERRTASNRDSRWYSNGSISYREVYLNLIPVGSDKSIGKALYNYIACHSFDKLIITNYVSPSCIVAIAYCKIKKIPYWVEYDGGFNNKDTFLKKTFKKFLIGKATGHMTTSDEHIDYLKSLGIDSSIIFKYPFSSVTQKDLLKANQMVKKGKDYYRKKLQMNEKHIVLSVGQFIHRKGFDLLINAAKSFDDVGVYIIGGVPTDEYIAMAQGKNNIHFLGFMNKEQLAEYYCAADIFVLLTREDIWGLVINEAMTFGLPIITTERCIAASEMVQDGDNGYIVPVNDYRMTVKLVNVLLRDVDLYNKMSKACSTIVSLYTIEKMAERHMEILSL